MVVVFTEGRESYTHHPHKLNVRTEIMANKIIGFFFINGMLTGSLYLELLEEIFIHTIVTNIKDDYDIVF